MTNYLVSDMLVRIKNGYENKKTCVTIKHSNFCLKFLDLLHLYGFINGHIVFNNSIVVKLKYFRNDHVFKNLKLVSKPGRRQYFDVHGLKKKFFYKDFVLVSNKYGLMTHKDSILKNCGGEVLFTLNYS